MRIGLLEAETLPPKVVDKFGSYGDMFVDLLSPLDPQLEFQSYAVDQLEFPRQLDDCNAYIITGSRYSAYDREEWIIKLQDLIRALDRSRKKCIGICFGHQIVAQALGGQVAKNDQGWGLGVATFQLHQQPSWLDPGANAFNILVTHQDQVVRLPPQAQLLASSDFCPLGGFTVGEHILCLQGHPEFTKEYLRYLIEKRRGAIGEPTVGEALESLELRVDKLLLARALYKFMSSGCRFLSRL